MQSPRSEVCCTRVLDAETRSEAIEIKLQIFLQICRSLDLWLWKLGKDNRSLQEKMEAVVSHTTLSRWRSARRANLGVFTCSESVCISLCIILTDESSLHPSPNANNFWRSINFKVVTCAAFFLECHASQIVVESEELGKRRHYCMFYQASRSVWSVLHSWRRTTEATHIRQSIISQCAYIWG